MLPTLLAPPTSPAEWSVWSYANRDQIRKINGAIQGQYGTNLTEYILYPMPLPPDDPTTWLLQNQLAHQQFTGALGLQSQDIQTVDFTNPSQVQAWINAVYLELYDASVKLGVA